MRFEKYQGPQNSQRVTPLARVRQLAAQGLTKKEAARELKMSLRGFQIRLAGQTSIYKAWEEGAQEAGTFCNNRRSLEADEGVILLQPIDHVVLAALRDTKGGLPKRKRVPLLRELTGLDTGTVVKALERLTGNLEIAVFEGVTYTEYEAFGEAKS